MAIYHRAEDILIGSLFGLILGIMLSLWASVFDHLFLQNASRDTLLWLFGFYSAGLIAYGIGIFLYIRKLERLGRHKTRE